MSEKYCDVCLFTSVPDEFNAASKVFERLARVTFASSFTTLGREVFFGTLQNLAGEALTVLISCLPEMGGTNATSHILPIVQQYRPRFVGMTGICAGDREKVMLGDLIVAVRAYEYEAGKVVLHDGRPQLLHDVKTFSPNDNIIGYVNLFSAWKDDVARLHRPPSKRQQRDWILSSLRSAGKRLENLDKQSLQANAPQWRSISAEMKSGQNSLLAADESLSDDAQTWLQGDWTQFTDRAYAEKFAMVMGSGRSVRSDNPFHFLRGPERKLIALDMEAASVYQAVETIASLGKRALVVKGVSDYGDEDKDDSFREYASEASAIYLFHFIRRYVTRALMPRLSAATTTGTLEGRESVRSLDSHRLQAYLKLQEGQMDRLSGLWELFHWPVPENTKSIPGRRVRGNLALIPVGEQGTHYHGIMMHVVDNPPNWEPQPVGGEAPFRAWYEVNLYMGDTLHGTSVLRFKEYLYTQDEASQYPHTGDFLNCSLSNIAGAARFVGSFETSSGSGPINFIFSSHLHWSEIREETRECLRFDLSTRRDILDLLQGA